LGIDVSIDRKVAFSEHHQNLLDTSIEKNPVLSKINGIPVRSIYRRRKSKDQKNDGNPLIYAMKQKHGYTISARETMKFLDSFYVILEKALDGFEADIIIPLPSSHKINTIFSRRISRVLNNAEIRSGLFVKKTTSEVIEELDLGGISSKSVKKDAQRLINDLSKTPKNSVFSMKEVSNQRLRKLINPLRFSGEGLPIDPKAKILLVDDLLASGSSMKGAFNAMVVEQECKNLQGLCLFSRL
jgi:pyrimidine operon attenuation protein/uracil phosphoribosyltransferase